MAVSKSPSSRTLVVIGLVGLAVCGGAYSLIPDPMEVADAPVFVEGQYTATLDQTSQRWRLSPHESEDIEVTSSDQRCANSVKIPPGIWLVTRDAEGRPELLAPSVTALPVGHDGRVQLLACGERGNGRPALAAPQILIDVLAERTGAIYVDG